MSLFIILHTRIKVLELINDNFVQFLDTKNIPRDIYCQLDNSCDFLKECLTILRLYQYCKLIPILNFLSFKNM